MIIRHSLPNTCFTKIDKGVFTDKRLTDGAKVLYGYLCGLRNGANFSDNYIMEAMDISKPSLARRKRELTEYGLILVDQIAPRVYVIYIGFSRCSAAQVKEQWLKEDDAKY